MAVKFYVEQNIDICYKVDRIGHAPERASISNRRSWPTFMYSRLQMGGGLFTSTDLHYLSCHDENVKYLNLVMVKL